MTTVVTSPAKPSGVVIILPVPQLQAGIQNKLTVEDVPGPGSKTPAFSIDKNDPAGINGTIIGNKKYTVIEKIGQGGMAAVYLARDADGNSYAIKVISPKFVGPNSWDMVSKRFQREAKILLDLTEKGNPKVVQAIESGSEDTQTLTYLVMEYIKGGTLKSNENLTLPQKLEILAGVCDALGDVHSEGIIHRDLKPANILLTELGESKIGDFGIAFNKDDLDRLTQTGVIVGTVDYLSHEQSRGEKYLGPQSDLCAIGIILYEIITGKNPFPGDTELAKINKRKDEPTRPSRVIKELNQKSAAGGSITEIDPMLEALIMKLLSPNPNDRTYGFSDDPGDDAREIAAALRAIKQRMESAKHFSPVVPREAALTAVFVPS